MADVLSSLILLRTSKMIGHLRFLLARTGRHSFSPSLHWPRQRVSTRGGFSFLTSSSKYVFKNPNLLKMQRSGMAPSRGWIIHSLEATPAILTEEDIMTASLGKITEFYQGVKTIMLLRLGGLPQDLREDLIRRSALDFYGVLYSS